MTYAEILEKIRFFLSSPDVEEYLQEISDLLQTELDKYTWVGFYFMNHDKQTLHLGPYSGKPTEHTVIPFGKGICGQVAVSGKAYLTGDVNAETNYIACSMDVRSEIVVPLYLEDELIAQIDVDSNIPNAFTEKDQRFLTKICLMLALHRGEDLKKTALSTIKA